MNPNRVDFLVDLAYGVAILASIASIVVVETAVGIAFGLGVLVSYVIHTAWKMARFDPEWMTREVADRVEDTVSAEVEKTVETTVSAEVEKTVEDTVGAEVEKTVEDTVGETVEKTVEDTVSEEVEKVEETVSEKIDEAIDGGERVQEESKTV